MDLHVERYGAGKPAIFIHGASGSSTSWYFQKEYLKQFMEVILLDLPGHGSSSGDGCERLEECRDAVHGVLTSLGLRKCFLVGHSMGGAIAMLFALTYPELMAGLVLVGTGAKLRVFPRYCKAFSETKRKRFARLRSWPFPRKHLLPLLSPDSRK